jgi:hypothetical protein
VASAAKPSAAERTPRNPTTAHTAITFRSISPTDLSSPLHSTNQPPNLLQRLLPPVAAAATATASKATREERGTESGGFGPAGRKGFPTDFFLATSSRVSRGRGWGSASLLLPASRRHFSRLLALGLGTGARHCAVGTTNPQGPTSQRLSRGAATSAGSRRRRLAGGGSGRSTVDPHECADPLGPTMRGYSGGAPWTRCRSFVFLLSLTQGVLLLWRWLCLRNGISSPEIKRDKKIRYA